MCGILVGPRECHQSGVWRLRYNLLVSVCEYSWSYRGRQSLSGTCACKAGNRQNTSILRTLCDDAGPPPMAAASTRTTPYPSGCLLQDYFTKSTSQGATGTGTYSKHQQRVVQFNSYPSWTIPAMQTYHLDTCLLLGPLNGHGPQKALPWPHDHIISLAQRLPYHQ
jgi:hypothetical protein